MAPEYKIPPLLLASQEAQQLAEYELPKPPQRFDNPLARITRGTDFGWVFDGKHGSIMSSYDSKQRPVQPPQEHATSQHTAGASGSWEDHDQAAARQTAIMQANAAKQLSFGDAALSVLPETYKISKEAGSNLPGPTALTLNGIDAINAAWNGDLQGMIIGIGGVIGGFAGKEAAKGFFRWHELSEAWKKVFPVAHQKLSKFRSSINEVLSKHDLSHQIDYQLSADGHEILIDNAKVASLSQLDRLADDLRELGLKISDITKVSVRDPKDPNRYLPVSQDRYRHLLPEHAATPNPAVSQAKHDLPEPHGRFSGTTPELRLYSESKMPEFKEVAKGIFGARRQSIAFGQVEFGPEAKYVRIPDMTITESPNAKWLDELHAWVKAVKALGVETIELPERITVHYEHGSFYAYCRSNYDQFFY